MLLKFIRDVASGKGRAFHTAFTGFQHRLQDSVGQLPPPQDCIQAMFLNCLRCYIHESNSFCKLLFYGRSGIDPVLTLNELRQLGGSNGSLFFSFTLIGLIRYSLVAEPEIADALVEVTLGILPGVVIPAAYHLSTALRDQPPHKCESIILDFLRQVLPNAANDAFEHTKFSSFLTNYAANLKNVTLNALEASAANA